MIKKITALLGLQYGDEGKGKIAAGIASQLNYFAFCRYNGGPNAGHTVTTDKGVLKLHQIPAAVAHKKHSHIAAGTVVDFRRLDKEVEHFQEVMGYDPREYFTIDPKCIVINQQHKDIDAFRHSKLGSTSSGIAPAYSDFYNRTAQLAGDLTYPDNHGAEKICPLHIPQGAVSIFLEGAQGWWLNPYQSMYPYGTSSSCHPASAAMTMGLPVQSFDQIIGVAKCYSTRSGIDPSFDKVLVSTKTNKVFISPREDQELINPIYLQLQSVGKEIGVTTGRQRQVRFLDATRLVSAINESGTTIVVVNKWDVLSEVAAKTSSSAYSFYKDGLLSMHPDEEAMKQELNEYLLDNCPLLERVMHSCSPANDIDWSEIL